MGDWSCWHVWGALLSLNVMLRNEDIVILFVIFLPNPEILHFHPGSSGLSRSLLPHCSLVLSIAIAPVMIRFFLGNQMPACKCDFLLCKDYFKKKKNKLSLKKISRSKRKPSFKSHLYRRQHQEILSVTAGWNAAGTLLLCSWFCV